MFPILRTRLDLECSTQASNENSCCRNAEQLTQNQNTNSCLSFVLWALLKNACLLSTRHEHSRSNLVFEKSTLRYDFIFRMLDCRNEEDIPAKKKMPEKSPA